MVVKGGKQNEKETASFGLSGKRKKKQPVRHVVRVKQPKLSLGARGPRGAREGMEGGPVKRGEEKKGGEKRDKKRKRRRKEEMRKRKRIKYRKKK